jgi:hypothetical protein
MSGDAHVQFWEGLGVKSLGLLNECREAARNRESASHFGLRTFSICPRPRIAG